MNVCHEFYIIKVCKLFCLAIFVVDFVGDKVNYSFLCSLLFSFILAILLKFIINCSAIYAAAAVKIKLNKFYIKY